jgi:hypothetical protein
MVAFSVWRSIHISRKRDIAHVARYEVDDVVTILLATLASRVATTSSLSGLSRSSRRGKIEN